MGDLQKAQAQLDEKEAELAKVRAMYDQAMREKQVSFFLQVHRTHQFKTVGLNRHM
jgi:hypothetical protein